MTLSGKAIGECTEPFYLLSAKVFLLHLLRESVYAQHIG